MSSVDWLFLWKEIGYPMKNANTKVKAERERRRVFEEWWLRVRPRFKQYT
jgi:hypothetical protein